jgi:hypothetical protein
MPHNPIHPIGNLLGIAGTHVTATVPKEAAATRAAIVAAFEKAIEERHELDLIAAVSEVMRPIIEQQIDTHRTALGGVKPAVVSTPFGENGAVGRTAPHAADSAAAGHASLRIDLLGRHTQHHAADSAAAAPAVTAHAAASAASDTVATHAAATVAAMGLGSPPMPFIGHVMIADGDTRTPAANVAVGIGWSGGNRDDANRLGLTWGEGTCPRWEAGVMVRTDARGAFTAYDVPYQRPLAIDINAEGFEPYQTTEPAIASGAKTEHVYVLQRKRKVNTTDAVQASDATASGAPLKPGMFCGRVIDNDTHEQLRDVRIQIEWVTDAGATERRNTVTDADGWFGIGEVPRDRSFSAIIGEGLAGAQPIEEDAQLGVTGTGGVYTYALTCAPKMLNFAGYVTDVAGSGPVDGLPVNVQYHDRDGAEINTDTITMSRGRFYVTVPRDTRIKLRLGEGADMVVVHEYVNRPGQCGEYRVVKPRTPAFAPSTLTS